MKDRIRRLEQDRDLPDRDLLDLIVMQDAEAEALLAQRAAAVRQQVYGRDVFIRGLIEFTNYCRNDCFYCGTA